MPRWKHSANNPAMDELIIRHFRGPSGSFWGLDDVGAARSAPTVGAPPSASGFAYAVQARWRFTSHPSRDGSTRKHPRGKHSDRIDWVYTMPVWELEME